MDPSLALPDLFDRAASLSQPRVGYRFGPENLLLPELLSAFPHPAPEAVLDLGAGCGILGLLASWTTGANCFLAERNPELLAHLRKNIEQQAPSGEVLEGDLREQPLPPVDIVVANPPFFRVGDGMRSKHETVRDATHAHHGEVDDFLRAGETSLRPGGHLWLLYPADRLTQALDAALSVDLAPSVICSIHARHSARSYRCWVRLERSPKPLTYLALSLLTDR